MGAPDKQTNEQKKHHITHGVNKQFQFGIARNVQIYVLFATACICFAFATLKRVNLNGARTDINWKKRRWISRLGNPCRSFGVNYHNWFHGLAKLC